MGGLNAPQVGICEGDLVGARPEVDEKRACRECFAMAVRAAQGRKPTNDQSVLDGVFRIVCAGSPQRAQGVEFGKSSGLYRQVRRWPDRGSRSRRPERNRVGPGYQADGRQCRGLRRSSGGGRKRGMPSQDRRHSRGGFMAAIRLRTRLLPARDLQWLFGRNGFTRALRDQTLGSRRPVRSDGRDR